MSTSNENQAIAYLQGALHFMDKARQEGNGTRELSLAFTKAEDALLRLEQDVGFKEMPHTRQLYLRKDQPYNPPEFFDLETISKLTEAERIGMFGYDPVEKAQAGGEQA